MLPNTELTFTSLRMVDAISEVILLTSEAARPSGRGKTEAIADFLWPTNSPPALQHSFQAQETGLAIGGVMETG